MLKLLQPMQLREAACTVYMIYMDMGGFPASAHLSLSQAACAGKAEVVVPADRPGKAGEEDPGLLETALPNCCYLLPDSRGYNDPVLSRDETVTA